MLTEPLGLNISPDDLAITGIVSGSQAECYGVPPGARIVAVDDVPVASYDGFLARRQAKLDEGAPVLRLRFEKSSSPTALPAAPADEGDLTTEEFSFSLSEPLGMNIDPETLVVNGLVPGARPNGSACRRARASPPSTASRPRRTTSSWRASGASTSERHRSP